MGWFDWLFGSVEHRRDPMPAEWRRIVERRVPHWSDVDAEEKAILDEIAMDLITSKRWEAAKDFTVTDEMVVTIAAQAALLAIGLPDGVYRKPFFSRPVELENEHVDLDGVLVEYDQQNPAGRVG